MAVRAPSGHYAPVRFDMEEWGDRIYDLGNALGRLELTLAVILVAGGFGAGVAILLGLAILPAILIGASVAAVGLVALWIRARRNGTTVFGDD